MPFVINPLFIYKSCILYLVIPILFFFFGWLRFGVGLVLSFLLVSSSILFLKKVKSLVNCDDNIILSKEYYVAFIILFLFLLCTGNTGFVGCWGTDIPWRNAIYQDLIRQPWPLTYEYSHSMLCYYMTFWLVPAAITSLCHLKEFGSNVVLFIWMYIGLVLIFFLLCDVLKPKKEFIILIAIVFLFFSGINILGMIVKSLVLEPSPLIGNYPGRNYWSFSDGNISGVDFVFIIRSTYLCLADVYNQFFAIAISTLLFYKFHRNLELYLFIALIVLPYSPIGFIGLFVVMASDLLVQIIKDKRKDSIINYFYKSLSVLNILTVLSIVPIFYFYFSINSQASAVLSSLSSGNSGYLSMPLDKITALYLAMLMLYYYFYFMIYACLIYDSYKSQSLFWAMLFCLLVFPFFKVGSSADFNYNASISPYLLLFIFIAKYLLNAINEKNLKIKDLILVFFLSISMLTPVTQIATSLRGAYINDSISIKWSPWNSKLEQSSFKDKEISILGNFLVQSYENTIFYKFFAKR